MTILDAKEKRPLEGGASFSLANRIERLIWQIVWLLLARWNPPFFSPWRVFLLRRFGARIEPGAAVAPSVKIWLPRHLSMESFSTIGPGVDCYNMAPISIGSYTTISQRSVLCAGTHSISDDHFQLEAHPIHIGSRVWIAAEAFVGPGVSVADGVVLGARACAFRDLRETNGVYVGNPAKFIKLRTEGANKGRGSQ